MARIGFGIAALASLGFAVWFLVTEQESPGLSFAVALVGMPFLLTLFGFSKLKSGGISKDGKGAGWAAVAIAVLGVVYIATFFGSWSIAAIIWLALHVPMVVGIVSLPTFED
jgi:hypothetical protein